MHTDELFYLVYPFFRFWFFHNFICITNSQTSQKVHYRHSNKNKKKNKKWPLQSIKITFTVFQKYSFVVNLTHHHSKHGEKWGCNRSKSFLFRHQHGECYGKRNDENYYHWQYLKKIRKKIMSENLISTLNSRSIHYYCFYHHHLYYYYYYYYCN